MRICVLISVLLSSVFAGAAGLQARFELDSKVYTAGVRLAEFRTDKVDVTYKVLSADEDKIVFNVYFTNISRKPVTVDSSDFFITSLNSRETVSGQDPEDMDSEADRSDYFPKATLGFNDSAGGQIVFQVKNSEGRWAFKNKMAPNSFNFTVKETE